MMRHRTLSFVAVSTVTVVLPARSRAAVQKPHEQRPNLVVILADDMGYSDIGWFGSEVKTPNIDRLGREGMTMTHFYNAGRSCPTRAALMTGMYHHKTGVGAMSGAFEGFPAYQGYLNNSCMTIAEVLKTAGYKTYMSGKWHLGSKPGQWPADRGFDRSYVFLEGATNYFRPNDHPKKRNNMAVDRAYIDIPERGYYITDAFSEHGAKFIREHKGSDPFFIYLAYTAPHWPLQAYPEDIAKYQGVYDSGWDKIRKERYERLMQSGIIPAKWALSPRNGNVPAWNSLTAEEKKEWAHKMEIYAAVIDRMDQGIGKVLKALEEKGQLDHTLILFLSDNGGCAEGVSQYAKQHTGAAGGADSFISYGPHWANVSNVPFRYFKHWMHEGGISTPFVVRYPQMIKAGGRSSQMLHITDIMATFIELSGAGYPEQDDKLKPLDGVSFVPILKGNDTPVRNHLFFEHLGYRAFREGDWKIVSVYPQNQWELYNMAEDRTELNDLSASMPDKVREMHDMYEAVAARSDVVPWKVIYDQVKAHKKKPDK